MEPFGPDHPQALVNLFCQKIAVLEPAVLGAAFDVEINPAAFFMALGLGETSLLRGRKRRGETGTKTNPDDHQT